MKINLRLCARNPAPFPPAKVPPTHSLSHLPASLAPKIPRRGPPRQLTTEPSTQYLNLAPMHRLQATAPTQLHCTYLGSTLPAQAKIPTSTAGNFAPHCPP